MKIKMMMVLMVALMGLSPAFAQESYEVIAQMKTQLDLQDDQVYNITPIIEKYTLAFRDLEKSIADNTINPSAIESQRQSLEEAETQELSAYLKPDQLSRWRALQAQMNQSEDQLDDEDVDADADDPKYTNYPTNPAH